MKNHESFEPDKSTLPNDIKSVELIVSETDKKKEPLLRRLYKSKLVRALALIGALEIGGELVRENHEDQGKGQTIEALQKNQLNVEELSKRFNIEVQVAAGSKSIIHIGQTHSIENLKTTQELSISDKVISSQEKIEEVILFLAEQYGVQDFYVEGNTDLQLRVLGTIRHSVDNAMDDSRQSILGSITSLLELQAIANVKDPNESGGVSAALLYSLKLGWNRMIAEITSAHAQYVGGENLSGAYTDFFDKLKQRGLPVEIVVKYLESHRDVVANNPLIRDRNIYLWGAAEKLFLEGKINIRVAESEEGLSQNTSSSPEDKLFLKQQNTREDIALDMVMQNPESSAQKVIPVIYGRAHDFKDNVEKYNKENPDREIGLIKISL